LEFLKRRASGFREIAGILFEKKEYELSVFNIEQAVQLEMKYFLGTRLGDYPKTHSLKHLFQESIKLCPDLKSLYERNVNIIGEIENACIMTRYYETSYEKLEISNMLEFHDELILELQKCGPPN
jgi:HEPN domain-containing protein